MMADWSALNQRALAQVHPVLRERVSALIALRSETKPILVTQGLRTYGEQAMLYAEGRTSPGPIVTHAQAGYSSHNFGLAVDVVPSAQLLNPKPDWDPSHPDWIELLRDAAGFQLGEGAQFRSFPDRPHLYLAELKDTPTDSMRRLLSDAGLPAVWAWVDTQLVGPLGA